MYVEQAKFLSTNSMIITNENKSTIKINQDTLTSRVFTKQEWIAENITSRSITTFKNNTTTQNVQETTSLEYYYDIFNEQNLNSIINLITGDIDMNACLANCSGHGICKMVNQALLACECFEHFSGSNCQLNNLPCSLNPCRNNATCVNNLVEKTYECVCYSNSNQTSLYYGQNCENKIDICQNETCSNKGVCQDVNDEKKCKCFLSYSGDKCELELSQMKMIKSVIRVASIIAIVYITLFFLSFILLDASDLIFRRQFVKQIKKYVPKKAIIVKKFIYKT